MKKAIKKRPLSKKINTKNVLLGIGVGILFLVLIFGYLYWTFIELPKRESSDLQKRLEVLSEQVSLNAYIRQATTDYGGDIPTKTLYYYVEILELKDYRLASTFFLRGKRSEELNRLTSASPDAMSKYIALLKEAINRNADSNPKDPVFHIDNPISVVLRKVPNGVWQIESIGQPL